MINDYFKFINQFCDIPPNDAQTHQTRRVQFDYAMEECQKKSGSAIDWSRSKQKKCQLHEFLIEQFKTYRFFGGKTVKV